MLQLETDLRAAGSTQHLQEGMRWRIFENCHHAAGFEPVCQAAKSITVNSHGIDEVAMNFPHRREFLHLAAGAGALPFAPHVARAQAYPSRPVRMIVGFPAGGGGDLVARLIGQWLSERLGQPFIIENRAGAGSNLGTEAVVRAPPDGYTLLQATAANAWNTTLYDNLKFDFLRDIVPVASIIRVPFVMEVNPSVPAKTVPEFIAYAKANPGKLIMASGGNGSPQHVSGELFKMMTGVDMLHVPYRGTAPAVTDLLAGQVQVMFDPILSSIEHIKAGKLRALAVTSATQSQLLPDIPIVGEFVPGYEASGWQGIGVPRNTPTDIINKLNSEVSAALVDSKFRAQLASLAVTPFANSPADFGKFIVEYTEKWAKVIRTANIKAE
jgi:tripartite-type tricarboxylate transporter receptor subunit TctC